MKAQAAGQRRQRGCDERSNADVETLRELEEALLEFAGIAMVISHDRWFQPHLHAIWRPKETPGSFLQRTTRRRGRQEEASGEGRSTDQSGLRLQPLH
jgi:ATPase subunit of ABC transporter with duplicated ATPase domains